MCLILLTNLQKKAETHDYFSQRIVNYWMDCKETLSNDSVNGKLVNSLKNHLDKHYVYCLCWSCH